MNQSKKTLSDIAIMRPILITSIIIGHAFAIFGNSQSWPIPQGSTQINGYTWITPTFISFALQAFVFVSGYLFAYKNPAQAPSNKWAFIKSKIKRIILPSLIFGILYILILHPQNYEHTSVILEILNGAGHLWFLPMLFWCYVFGVIGYKFIHKASISAFLLLGILSFASFLLPNYFGFAIALHYFIYYVLGMWVFINKDRILFISSKYKHLILIPWIVIGVLCVIKIACINITSTTPSILLTCIKVATNILLGVIGSLSLWITINLCIKDNNIKIRGDIWFGLYIYHQFIMMLLYYHTRLPLIVNSIGLPWLVLATTYGSSVLLVILTLKTKIGRWLIG